jgi:hypothetical protein
MRTNLISAATIVTTAVSMDIRTRRMMMRLEGLVQVIRTYIVPLAVHSLESTRRPKKVEYQRRTDEEICCNSEAEPDLRPR